MIKLKYYQTDIDIYLGDRINYKKLFKTVSGSVVYIPNQSKENKSLGDDTWAIQLDDEPNDVITMIFVPSQEPFAHKRVRFLSRGGKENQIQSKENIL